MASNKIDLINLLRNRNNREGTKVVLHGRFAEELPKPSNLINVEDDDAFIYIKFDTFAVELSSIAGELERVHQMTEPDDTYMVNGNICLYVPKNSYHREKFYSVQATLRFGDRERNSTYVVGFNLKRGDNSWRILPNHFVDFDISKWSNATTKYRIMSENILNNRLERISMVEVLPKFYAIMRNNTVVQTLTEMPEVREENNLIVPMKTVKREKFESRKRLMPESETANRLFGKMHDSNVSYFQTKKDICNNCLDGAGSGYKYILYMFKNLNRYKKLKPISSAYTGRTILSKYLKHFDGADEQYLGSTVKDILINNFDDIVKYFETNEPVPFFDKDYQLFKRAFYSAEKAYSGLLAIILGLDYDKLTHTAYLLNEMKLSFAEVIHKNPYYLGILVNTLSFNDIETIAVATGKFLDKDIAKWKNICMLNSYLEDTSNNDTCLLKNTLQYKKIGVIMTKSKYESACKNGTHLSPTMSENIRYYIKDYQGILSYDVEDFEKGENGNYVIKIQPSQLNIIINDYVESGLGVIYNDYVMSHKYLQKELTIYFELRKLASRSFDYDPVLLECYISEYEKQMGENFKLEKEQRDAVKLLFRGSGVISGSAGSGKTTVANCLKYVLQRFEPKVQISFAAPTGKAAKRLQEVVNEPVKTIHSLFSIAVGYGEEDETLNGLYDGVFFIDESAMITVDVFYTMIKRLNLENSRVYFFGDFNQLPPIGKGLVFKNMLRFMPCSVLTVSKRAGENSGITYNSNIITDFSDSDNFKPLVNTNDFKLYPCGVNDIDKYIKMIVRYLLDVKSLTSDEERLCHNIPKIPNLTADDIQVVSPLSKARYNWGTTHLNEVLQPVFNDTHGYSKTIVNCKPKCNPSHIFRIGDRVIHTTKNLYDMQRYILEDKQSVCKCTKIHSYSVLNGEVGHIIGFYEKSIIKFEEGRTDEEIKEADSKIRDDEQAPEDTIFVAVKYNDYNGDYVILYRCEENTFNSSNEGITLFGEDLDYLDLFYAGTTHKLQGSQNKVIICAIGRFGFGNFISRNMLYTTVTRGQELVICVGDIRDGKDYVSQMTQGRLTISDDATTIGEIFK